jgi:peptidoglycan hydrolase-like protein with peptidoglycan-binding domain
MQMVRLAVIGVGASVALMLLVSSGFAQAPLVFVQPLAPPAVRAVQERLHAMGAYQGMVDGTWGPDSQSALQQFQQSHGLQLTGQMNAATAAALGLDAARLLQLVAMEQPPPMRLGPDAIRNVQQRLQQLGFYTAAADGVWGPGTQEAVARLQQNRGLQPTGRLDPATVSALGLDPNNPAAPPR